MKFLFTTLLLVTSLVASANMKECRNYSNEVLSKAITEDPKAGNETHPYRMAKDEKKALEFIKKFDVKKLGFKINKEARINILKDCKQLANNSAADAFCNNSFEIFNYFRALTHGMKHFGWSAGTITLAKKQIESYVAEVAAVEPSLLDTMLAANVLVELGNTGHAKGLDTKALAKLNADLDAANLELKKNAMDRNGPMNCKDFQAIAAQEIKQNAVFSKRLLTLNKF